MGEGGQDRSPWVGEVHCSTASSSVPAGLDLGPCPELLAGGHRDVLLCNSEAGGSALGRRPPGRGALQHGFSLGGSVIPSQH